MNSLQQQKTLLIGSTEDIENLEKLSFARLLILSDTHGESEVTEGIIREYGADCDALVFSGDGINDIITCLEKANTDKELMESIPPVIAFARGNGDADSYIMALCDEDNEADVCIQVSERQILHAASRTILIVHGHRQGVDFGTETLSASAKAMDADIVFYGHTHRPRWEENEASLILNPGSCSRPRGGFPPSFSIVTFPGTTERYTVEYYTISSSLFGVFSFDPLDIESH